MTKIKKTGESNCKRMEGGRNNVCWGGRGGAIKTGSCNIWTKNKNREHRIGGKQQ